METSRIIAAVTELEECSNQNLKSEARALATLLRHFSQRADAEIVETPIEIPEGHDKHWTVGELKAVGRKVSFAPHVYISREGRRRTFHRPDCFLAKYGESDSLENAVKKKARPCDWCGGVRFSVDELEQAHQIDTIREIVQEIRRFALGDFAGLIHILDAATIMGWRFDELDKECRKEAGEQLRGVTEDRYFQFQREVNVLRYKEHPKDRGWQFKFNREDCIRYSRKFGPLSPPSRNTTYPEQETRRKPFSRN